MNVGFDYFNTITENPTELAEVARSLNKAGHTIYVISAISGKVNQDEYTQVMKEFLKEIDFPFDTTCLVVFSYSEQVPKLKLEECINHKIKLFVDDREDVGMLLKSHGIAALKSILIKGRKGLNKQLLT